MFRKKEPRQPSRSTNRSSASTYSYYSNASLREDTGASRSPNQTDRLKSTSKWWHHLPSIAAALVIIGCLSYSLILNANPIIVQAGNNKDVFLQSSTVYEQAARQLFRHSIFNANKITVDVSGVTKSLKKQFPELADVTVTLPIISHRPLIYIVPSDPTVILQAKNGSFILNESGVAVIPTNKVNNLAELNIATVQDHSNLDVNLGKPALTAENVKFMRDIYAQLKAQKEPVTSMVLPPNLNELDLKLQGYSFYTKMDMQADAKEQVGTLLATLSYLKTNNITPSTYIDVRVSGRAYYK